MWARDDNSRIGGGLTTGCSGRRSAAVEPERYTYLGVMMEKSLPWPSEYKYLFVQGGDFYEFAHFGWGNIWQQFYGYCTGYKESADRLIVDAISSKDTSRLDSVVFPAFFLYRQFIELSLKQAILQFSGGNYAERVLTLKQLNHDLIAMWKEFIKVLPEARDQRERTTLEVVEKYIEEFSTIDRSSFSFRYPITKDLKPIFGEEQRINLRHVKERMDELESFFSGAEAYMDELRTSENEMRAEFEDEFYQDGF